MFTRPLIYATLIVGALAASVAAQQPSAPDATEEQVRALLREALEARQTVRTGRVNIKGHYRYHVLNGDAGFEGPVTGHYCFDREANVYRYDGEWPCKSRIIAPGDFAIEPPDASTPTRQVKYGFCRARDYFANWSQIAPNVTSGMNLRPLRDEQANRSHGCGRWPLDVMALGMFEHHLWQQGSDMSEVYSLWREMTDMAVVSEVDDKIGIKVGRNGWFCRIDFDRNRLAPVHLEEVVRIHSREGELPAPSHFTSDTTWRKVNGVSVPVKYSLHYAITDGRKQAAEETLELELQWLIVNQDIPDEEFEYTAFTGVPPKIMDVTDMRGEKPKHLGWWLEDGGVLEPWLPAGPSWHKAAPQRE